MCARVRVSVTTLAVAPAASVFYSLNLKYVDFQKLLHSQVMASSYSGIAATPISCFSMADGTLNAT